MLVALAAVAAVPPPQSAQNLQPTAEVVLGSTRPLLSGRVVQCDTGDVRPSFALPPLNPNWWVDPTQCGRLPADTDMWSAGRDGEFDWSDPILLAADQFVARGNQAQAAGDMLSGQGPALAKMSATPIAQKLMGSANYVQYVHFSGSGGEAMVHYARDKLGLKATGEAWNGNAGCACNQADHVLALYPNVDRCSCNSQEGLALTAAFVANENPVLSPLGCPRVQYWVLLREPMERIRARLLRSYADVHEQRAQARTSKGVAAFYDEAMLSPDVARAALRNASSLTWFVRPKAMAKEGGGAHGAWSMCHEFSGTVVLNEWYVRSLNGPAVYRQPVGSITEDHYAVAEGVLRNAQVVLPSEHLASLPALLAKLVGVDASAMPPLEAHAGSKQDGAAASLDHQLETLLKKHNRLDSRLYQYAEQRFAAEMAQAQ